MHRVLAATQDVRAGCTTPVEGAGAALAQAALMRNIHFIVLSLALAAGCSKKAAAPEEAEPASAADQSAVATQSAAEEAKTTFKTVCATCHGESGTGNGPGAATLNPKPRNYTDKTWQASVTDDQIKQTILMGGAAVGKSPAMPAQPQLKEKPEVVAALVQIIRTFGK
ncbi:MAG TPA: cytochrome c [Kofleriaceae bacterium]|nr:cytochrome c [Kofleriaceae bacterium]